MEHACAIAKASEAQVSGLAVLDTPGIEHSVGAVPVGGLHYAKELEDAREEEAHERIQTLLGAFTEKCEKEGVAHTEAERQGSPSDCIIHDAIFYDLVVIGMRTYFHFETSGGPGDSLETILDHSVTPILAVPDHFDGKSERKVLIAFDGSPPAARALHRFAQLAGALPLGEVTLLTSDEDAETANYYLDQAEAYLKAHGVNDIRKVWTPEEIVRAVREDYLDQADTVVVGAHSKRGLLDFMMGSLTKSLIEAAKKPVLVGQ
jgi:nucleotide-binding universal stress UspA family protein